ncbi:MULTISPECIES: aroma-sacti cluster domain-containing protein [Nonomuraea]|uniref:aroma-sacti cluster domain-containing protein n=1 Tax=Nonomuraea TaxID=83681 RepID=UPI001404F288|nr:MULTISPECIES: aroma-sacti cluster domain-containing protein [Nonomuraea]
MSDRELPLEPMFLTAEARAVLASLSAEEVAVLEAVRERIEAVAGDVEAHVMGASFW